MKGRTHVLCILRAAAVLLGCMPISSAAQDDTAYRLGVEDVIRIVVPGRPELTVDVVVEADGRVRVPELGPVNADGRSTADLEAELSSRYNILHRTVSEVFVSVLQYNSRKITVVGEVRSPGSLSFRAIPDLVQVILRAGGPTPLADLSNVRVLREEQREGEPRVIHVDLSQGLVDTDPATLPTLQPHDTVVITAVTQQPVAGATYQVLGAVTAPGIYSLREGLTVVEAIAIAGGAASTANLNRVHLTRRTDAGVMAYELNVQRHLSAGQPGVDFALRPGDTLTVSSQSSFWSVGLRTIIAVASAVTAISTLSVALRR